MWQPPIELLHLAGGRFAAAAMVAERARQLRAGALPAVGTGTTHPVTAALEELMRGKLKLGIPPTDLGLCESWWPATNGEGGSGPMSGGSVNLPAVRTVATAAPPPAAPPRTARSPSVRGMRAGLTLWVVLAVAGWGAAGVAGYIGVRAYLATSRLAVLSGLTPVQGPGVEVMMADGDRVVRAREKPSVVLVQDGDVILLNMMLWYGGAKAVAINGERLTAQSTITSSGPTLVINARRMVGPFQVLAIGDPEVLTGVLEARGGFADRMRQAGLRVDIVPRETLTVPAANPDRSAPSPPPSPEAVAP